MSFDLRNCGKWILIRPHGLDGLPSSSGNAVVIAVPFIGTVGSVIRPFQLGEINMLTRNILNGRIIRFAECQGVAGIGDHATRDRYYDASTIMLDRNRMIGTWILNLSLFHVSLSFCKSSDSYDDPAERAPLN